MFAGAGSQKRKKIEDGGSEGNAQKMAALESRLFGGNTSMSFGDQSKPGSNPFTSEMTSKKVDEQVTSQLPNEIEKKEERPFVVRANDAIDIKLVKDAKDQSGEIFHPEFCHQIFDKEEIYGYEEPKLNILYSADWLEMCLLFTYKTKAEPVRSFEFGGLGLVPHTHSPDDVVQILSDSLKLPFYSTDIVSYTKKLDSLERFSPKAIGLSLVNQYESKGHTFEVHAGTFDSAELVEYHTKLRTFSQFFIDAASFIDDGDDRWRLYVVYQVDSSNRYTLVGYTTVYRFYAYPDSEKFRISQMVVLPPFQRQGHGYEMFNIVYKSAIDSNAQEVNFEDPSFEMTRLRLYYDCKYLVEKGHCHCSVVGPTIEEMRRIAKEMRLNFQQTRRCFELMAFAVIDKEDMDMEVQFRHRVKQRIFYQEAEIIGSVDEAEKKKEIITEFFDECMNEYSDLKEKVRAIISST